MREATTPLEYLGDLLATRLRVTDINVLETGDRYHHDKHVAAAAKLILIASGSVRYELEGMTLGLRTGSMLYRPGYVPAEWTVSTDGPCHIYYVEWDADTRSRLSRPVWVGVADLELESAAFHRIRGLACQLGETPALEAEGELKAMMARFFCRAVNPVPNPTTRTATARGAAGEAAIRAAMSYLAEHLADPDALVGLPQRVGLNEDHFRVIFRKKTGMSAQRYLTHLRMAAARSYLERSNLTVKEVARAVGYTDPLYFSRHYHKVFGRPPTAERVRRP